MNTPAAMPSGFGRLTQEGRPGGPGQPGELRIGTAEREQAATALGEHFSAGRLDSGEFEDRVQAAYRARTRSELDALFAVLPSTATRPARLGPPERASRRSSGRYSGYYRHYRGLPRVGRRLMLLGLLVAVVVTWTALLSFPPLFLIPIWFFVIRPHARGRRMAYYRRW